jgi:hypothetical protein
MEVLPATRPRRRKHSGPPPRSPIVPRSWTHHDGRRDLTRVVHDTAAVRRRESYASTPSHEFINPLRLRWRQRGNASIASKRRYDDDAVVRGGSVCGLGQHPRFD